MLTSRQFTTQSLLVAWLLSLSFAIAPSQTSAAPIHDAATQGNITKIKSLIGQGADVNQKDAEGNTPLHRAAISEKLDTMIFLLSLKADIEAKDQTGQSPMLSQSF